MFQLNVLTREDPADAVPIPATVPCDGSLTCPCDQCVRDRAQRMRQPRRPHRQPWDKAA